MLGKRDKKLSYCLMGWFQDIYLSNYFLEIYLLKKSIL